MKNYKKIIEIGLTLFLVTFLTTGMLTQLPLEISANNIEELEQKEQERENNLLNQLLLDVPTQTDNPSHIITFVDPSETNEGVELDIDEKGFETITSPYALPALGIGDHELRFRFVDELGSTQIIEKEIIIIPRPPIINSPTFEDESLYISGTGLANSELILILSSDREILVKETSIDSESNWEIQIDREELREGIFTFTAFTRRYGYSSDLAEPTTFEVGDSNRLTFDNGKEIYFSFSDISIDDIGNILSNNIDLGLLVGGSFILGFLISLLIFSLIRSSIDNKTVKIFEEKIKNGDKKKELTLKEKLSQKQEGQEKREKQTEKEEKKDKKKKKKKEVKKGKDKTEKILTKVDFLKDYKKFDPDDKQGEEKDNIEVKVTSKK
jgi:Na+-translocating ferredoxin:NAD+ oxidoreductase RnfG subunit